VGQVETEAFGKIGIQRPGRFVADDLLQPGAGVVRMEKDSLDADFFNWKPQGGGEYCSAPLTKSLGQC